MCARAINGIANLGAQFHHGLMHLGLNLLLKEAFSALENLVNMRPQLTRFRIDDGELLFDTESKRMVLRAHGGRAMSAKNSLLSSRLTEVPARNDQATLMLFILCR